ncbi:insulinase family protein, partial [bacterium]
MYKKLKLGNGLRIITHRMPGMQSVSLGIWIKVGGRYENEENKGISHFLEHLLFKGTKNYSCRQIKESIEGVGGSLNGFTSEEVTCYLVKMPYKHIELALNVLSDMVISPVLSEGDIVKERTVILEEIKMYKDLPQVYVHELLDGLMWPKHPLGLSILGSVDSVNAMGRKDLLSHKEKYYNVGNMVVSAAGIFDHEDFAKKVERIFGRLKSNPVGDFIGVSEKQGTPQLDILDKQTEQTHLALGFHAFKRDHPLKYAADMLHIVLGANMSSRLFNEVREKRGLAYEIGSQVKRYYDTGTFIVHAGIDNRKIQDAIKVILLELGKVKKNMVSPDEFKRAKEFYLGQLTLALEDTMDYMLWIGELTATLDKTHTLKGVIEEVKKVKRQDLLEVSRLIFKNNKLNLALIGPLVNNREEIY